MKLVYLAVFVLIILSLLPILASAVTIKTRDNVFIEFKPEDLDKSPELKNLVRQWTRNEFVEVYNDPDFINSQEVQQLENEGLIQISGNQAKKVLGGDAEAGGFLTFFLLAILASVPLTIIYHEVARNKHNSRKKRK